MVYSKCKYWKLAHDAMNCKNCMVPNKDFCRINFYNAENVNIWIDDLEDQIKQLEENDDNWNETLRIMRDDYD